MTGWIGARTLDLEMVDGAKYRAVTIFADAVAYETAARKHGYGDPRTSMMQALAFVSWHALRRVGDIPTATTYESFRDSIAQVRPDNGEDDVNPTEPGPRPG